MRQKLISWTVITLFSFVFLYFTPPTFAANVVINEFLANPAINEKEWVELYNLTASDVSLVGWKLVDAKNSTKSLDSLGVINAGGFVFYEVGEGWLNNSDPETIQLKDSTGVVVDNYSYSIDQKENITTGRDPNGTGNFSVLATATKGLSNSLSLPTETPTSVPTVTPTNSPTPTKIPTPASNAASASPTNKPTATPKVTQAPSPSPTMPKMAVQESFEEEKEDVGPTSILGEMVTASPSEMPTEIASKPEKSFFNFPTLSIGIGFVFLTVSGILAFRSYKKNQEDDYR